MRPYLARERAALERLAEVSSLTSDEADRLATLKKSRWSGEYAVPTPTADLLSTYKDNEVRADARWKGHGVEISATVKTVKKNAMDSIFAVLGTGRGVEAVTAHCEVSDRYAERVATWNKGDKVTVRAEVKGMILGAVILGECEPVE